jgi:hypothetical protein
MSSVEQTPAGVGLADSKTQAPSHADGPSAPQPEPSEWMKEAERLIRDYAEAMYNFNATFGNSTTRLARCDEAHATLLSHLSTPQDDALLRQALAVMLDDYNSGEAECIAAIRARLAKGGSDA